MKKEADGKSRSSKIFHISFDISHLDLFAPVRVISWIVLCPNTKQAIHEITRIITRRDASIANETCQMIYEKFGFFLLLPPAPAFCFLLLFLVPSIPCESQQKEKQVDEVQVK
jgi:hypothetical protein